MDKILVTKASGDQEAFSTEKVRQSLKRAGAKPQVIDKILTQVIGKLHNGISTRAIYRQVFKLLNQYQAGQGYRYSLKDALMQLGPSGYPFEKFIARLLKTLDFTTEINVIVSGQCVNHEIDVLASKDSQYFLVECKFHNRPGTKTRSKEVLYTQARFDDLVEKYKTDPQSVKKFHQPWLVTNTKLTSNAIKYGTCKNMKLLAWRYPQKNSLEQLIEKAELHPITILSFLDNHDRMLMFQNDLILCQDLIKLKSSQLEDIGINSSKVKQILEFLKSDQS